MPDIYDEFDNMLHVTALNVIKTRAVTITNNDELAGATRGVCALVDAAYSELIKMKFQSNKEGQVK